MIEPDPDELHAIEEWLDENRSLVVYDTPYTENYFTVIAQPMFQLKDDYPCGGATQVMTFDDWKRQQPSFPEDDFQTLNHKSG